MNRFNKWGSFKFQIAITLRNGKRLSFTASGADTAYGVNDYFSGKAYVTVSPQELGTCEDTDSLIQCLCDGVYDETRPIFTFAEQFWDDNGYLRDPRAFIDTIEAEIASVSNIDYIEVTGEAAYDDIMPLNPNNCCLQYYRYDMDSKRFEGIVYGDPKDIAYTTGELNIRTVGCKIRRVAAPEDFMNRIEDTDNDDYVDSAAIDYGSPEYGITDFNSIDLPPFGQFGTAKSSWLKEMFGGCEETEDDEDGEDIVNMFESLACEEFEDGENIGGMSEDFDEDYGIIDRLPSLNALAAFSN